MIPLFCYLIITGIKRKWKKDKRRDFERVRKKRKKEREKESNE